MNLHRPNRLRLSALGPVSGWQRDRFFCCRGTKATGSFVVAAQKRELRRISRLLLQGRSSPAPAWQLGGPKPEVGEIGARRRRWGRGGPAAAPPCPLERRASCCSVSASHRAPSAAPDPTGGGGGGWAAPEVGEMGGAGGGGEDDAGGEQRGASPRGGSTQGADVAAPSGTSAVKGWR
jgi:hypothetical protein